ncbi:MAG TPA: sensor histidine kinase [Bauldia sp.]|nr:sensor histidine kinase [Bauldia sp.]
MAEIAADMDLSARAGSASAPMPETAPRGRPIAVYLVLFGLAVALPALLFSGYLLYRFEAISRDSATRVAQDTAASIRDIVDRELAAMATTLRVLSTSGFLRSGELEAFHARATAALEDTGNFVILADADGNQLLNTRVPYGSELGPISDRATIEAVLANNSVYVSDIFYGSVAEQYVFNVALPAVMENGERLVLVMTRNARSLDPIIRQLKLDPGWSGALVDRNGVIVASTAGGEAGQRAGFLADASGTEASVTPVTFTGEAGEMVLAVRRSFESGWRATASVPAAVIEAPLWNSLKLLLGAGIALLLLTALLALLFARLVSRPMLRLAGQAHALGQGAPIAPLASPVREVNEVSLTLVSAAEERKRSEDHIRFLMRELSHRAKNQLAVVVAMARRTAEKSEDMVDFERVFSERLMALARSTDLLVNQNWRGVALDDLIHAHLMPFVAGNKSRLVIRGRRVALGPDAAQSIGLALHELATNASKYGALSVPEGIVTITWRPADSDPRGLRIEWIESGGPTVTEPTRTGFGTIVIQRTVAQSLNGEVTHEFRSEGVFWAIDLPPEAIGPEGK